jgi:hypothetical protein
MNAGRRPVLQDRPAERLLIRRDQFRLNQDCLSPVRQMYQDCLSQFRQMYQFRWHR